MTSRTSPGPERPEAASRVVSNILSLMAGETASRAIAFFGTVYLARILSPSGFGIIGFATAICGYVAMAVTAGFNELGAREVARRPRDAARIATSVIAVRLALALLAFAALAVFAFLLPKPPVVRQVVLLSGLTLFVIASDTAWAYKGIERNRRVGLAQIVSQSLYVAALFLFVRGAADVVRVPLAQFFGDLCAALFLAVPLFRSGSARIDLQEGTRLLRLSGSVTLLRLLRTVVVSLDVVLLGYMLGEREVGIYTAAYRICFLLLAFAIAIHVAYLPAMTRAASIGATALADTANRSFELAAAVAIPATVGGALLARPILATIFGPAYAEGASALGLLLLSVGFFFLSQATHNVLLAVDRIRVEMRIVALAASLNAALNLLLIPRYGVVGAAGVTALSEGLVLAGGTWAIRSSGVRLAPGSLLRPLLCAGVMALLLAPLDRVGGAALAVAGGSFAYCALLIVLSGVPREIREPFQNWRSQRGG